MTFFTFSLYSCRQSEQVQPPRHSPPAATWTPASDAQPAGICAGFPESIFLCIPAPCIHAARALLFLRMYAGNFFLRPLLYVSVPVCMICISAGACTDSREGSHTFCVTDSREGLCTSCFTDNNAIFRRIKAGNANTTKYQIFHIQTRCHDFA